MFWDSKIWISNASSKDILGGLRRFGVVTHWVTACCSKMRAESELSGDQ